ncbi:DNA polymerase III subunit delta' [Streptomyces sp. DH37]|uniref:DNA polymerase III subunit delta' n=1 Tax=Streptomyces sp. DH37 TaxID=3040122 RepID=UPI002442BB2E|nr:DNA polymerase III subunit delta' [Streptomyces sp. DH37]MDG9702764.1 DNA polymerase III subunit delta' [Streptomyces sp. DH37]
MAVWDDLIGQDRVVEQLAAAARDADAYVTAAASGQEAVRAASSGPSGSAMTHAWLFTGPPGSGLGTAARAFAAALQCVSPDRALGGVPGCGFCDGCHTALIGTHADVEVVRAAGLSTGVGDTRDLVRRAQLSPSGGRWQVVVHETADRLTEQAANALLKAVEEPAPRTVWLLCAPSADDVLPTIRSRCRHMVLRTPPVDAVADLLIRRDGIEPEEAVAAARATQGHIDRARRLATDARARTRRAAVLALPTRMEDIGDALRAAQQLVDAAGEDAREAVEETDAKETEEMRAALGASEGGRLPRGTAGVMKDLEKRQKSRATRAQRDSLDLALLDLTAFYRDVLVRQLGSSVAIANEDVRDAVERIAASTRPEQTLRRMEAVLECRRAVERNVAPLLAVEAMAVALRAG